MVQQVIWPPEAPLDVHRKLLLVAHGFKKAPTDEEKAEQDATLAAETKQLLNRAAKQQKRPKSRLQNLMLSSIPCLDGPGMAAYGW